MKTVIMLAAGTYILWVFLVAFLTVKKTCLELQLLAKSCLSSIFDDCDIELRISVSKRYLDMSKYLVNKNMVWYLKYINKLRKTSNLLEVGEIYKQTSFGDGQTLCFDLIEAENSYKAKFSELTSEETFLVTKVTENPNIKINHLDLNKEYILVEILLRGSKRYLVFAKKTYTKQMLNMDYEKIS